jgi:hypothetical protein
VRGGFIQWGLARVHTDATGYANIPYFGLNNIVFPTDLIYETLRFGTWSWSTQTVGQWKGGYTTNAEVWVYSSNKGTAITNTDVSISVLGFGY